MSAMNMYYLYLATVLQRKDANPDLKTGEIEVKVEKFEIDQ